VIRAGSIIIDKFQIASGKKIVEFIINYYVRRPAKFFRAPEHGPIVAAEK
jgi:hypothetical protein